MLTGADRELDSFYRVIASYYNDDYADIHGGRDIEFYRNLAQNCPGPVLEMGCGTGRILLPLARAGVVISGMDRSLAMLERLTSALHSEPAEVRERVTTIHGDIRCDDAGGRFRLIIAGGNVLSSFIDRTDQRAWLRNVRRTLTADGEFCFDVFQPDYSRLLAPAGEWIPQFDRIDGITGDRIRRFYRCEQELEFQRFRVMFRWITEDSRGVLRSDRSASVMQRWFVRGELENLLELEGFQIVNHWGDFNAKPFGKGSTEQIIRAAAQQHPRPIEGGRLCQ
jgi:SAM-dependent methyltransferase